VPVARHPLEAAGFTLIETLVSVAMMTAAALGVAQLFAVATSQNVAAKNQTTTSILAAQKMEQLRGLTWGYTADAPGLPITDTTTDLSTEPPTALGTGLNASPAGSLDASTPGFVDYLDRFGQWVGTGAAPVDGTVYIRRWSIEPLPTNPNNTLIFQVLVTTSRREQLHTGTGARARLPEDAWLVGVKTRKAP
jgi:type II secretory pathway pseudopilin PulG